MEFMLTTVRGSDDAHLQAVKTPGAGPRHMVFHPTLPVVYVINEMHSTVSVYNYDAVSCT